MGEVVGNGVGDGIGATSRNDRPRTLREPGPGGFLGLSVVEDRGAVGVLCVVRSSESRLQVGAAGVRPEPGQPFPAPRTLVVAEMATPNYAPPMGLLLGRQ